MCTLDSWLKAPLQSPPCGPLSPSQTSFVKDPSVIASLLHSSEYKSVYPSNQTPNILLIYGLSNLRCLYFPADSVAPGFIIKLLQTYLLFLLGTFLATWLKPCGTTSHSRTLSYVIPLFIFFFMCFFSVSFISDPLLMYLNHIEPALCSP